jgi:hypothetical protein
MAKLQLQKNMTQTALEELLIAREELAQVQTRLLSSSSEAKANSNAYDYDIGETNGTTR